MSLVPGTQLDHYTILELVGRGGMGAVYRMRDTRLGRDVAVKVSNERFSDRFDREARVVASLNHPNICTLFDIGSAPEAPGYLVMEYIEGSSPQGPLPVDTACEYARQIALALEDAHSRGVVHRDLKPGNIKITPSGLVKVLDFGLAKVTSQSAEDAANSPTISLAMTQAGMILGTAAYMAPEQARGKPVDKRADIWAFGVVFYELLTGRRPFQGEDVSETLAAVIKEQPLWEGVPPKALPLLKACLEKDPVKRLRDIGDAGRLLDLSPTAVDVSSPAVPSKTWAGQVAWIVAAAMACALAGLSWVHFRETPASLSEIRFQIPAPVSATSERGLFGFRLSPDGKVLAMVSSHEGVKKIYVRRLDTLDLRELPGSEIQETGTDIFWSPDSANIGFFADGKLKRVGLDGRAPRIVCNVANSRGGAWNRDGVILFSGGPSVPLMRVSAEGGTPEPVTEVGPNEGDRYPEFLPDQKRFFYLHASDDPAKEGVYVGSLDRTPPKRVLAAGGNVVFVPGSGSLGYLLYRSQGSLVAQEFDTSTLQTSGDQSPLADQVRTAFNNIYWGSFSATSTVLMYWEGIGTSTTPLELSWIDRAGKRTPVATAAAAAFRTSPDGRRLAFLRRDKDSGLDPDLWVMELSSGRTFRAGRGVIGAVWSSNGQELAFASRNVVKTSVYRVLADGGSKPQLLGPLGVSATIQDWSPDGKWLLAGLNQGIDIGLFSMDAPYTVSDYVRTPAVEASPRFSPDGKWVAYTSEQTIYVQSMPLTTARFPVSPQGVASGAKWSLDGKELYYVSQNKLMAVPVRTSPTFEAGTPHVLIDPFPSVSFEPTRDSRFLVAVPLRTEPVPPLTVVVNWKP